MEIYYILRAGLFAANPPPMVDGPQRSSDTGRPRTPWPSPEAMLFLLLFISFGWFGHSNPGWNVNSRLALSTAWAATGRPQVDAFVPRLDTQDLAVHDGHLYSDKSIGTSILGVPAASVVRGIEATRGEPFSPWMYGYLVNLGSVVPATALAGVLLMKWLAMLWPQASRRHLPLLAAGVMLGSMLFLYGSLFMSYGPATLFLLATLIYTEKAAMAADHHAAPPQVWRQIALAGLCGGLTILSEYLYAAAVGLAGLYLLHRCGRRHLVPGALLYGAGCILGNLPFIIYSTMIFGRPSIPYEFHLVPEFRAAMSMGIMGATWPPKGSVLWLTTFHPFRGIFFYSPMLLLGLAGLFAMMSHRSHLTRLRPTAVLCAACIAFYVLFNACYYMWWGGWSFAPRHLAPTIPFLAAGLGVWMNRRLPRMLLIATGTIGVLFHLLVNATEPQVPDGGWQLALLQPSLAEYDYPNTFMAQIWPRVTAGHFDWNIGTALGIGASGGVALLALLWLIAGLAFWRSGTSPSR